MAGSIQIYKRTSQELVHQRERAHSALSESKESIGGIDMGSKLSQNENMIDMILSEEALFVMRTDSEYFDLL